VITVTPTNNLLRSGARAWTGNANYGGFKGTNMLAGSDPLDGVNKTQLDGCVLTNDTRTIDLTSAIVSFTTSGIDGNPIIRSEFYQRFTNSAALPFVSGKVGVWYTVNGGYVRSPDGTVTNFTAF